MVLGPNHSKRNWSSISTPDDKLGPVKQSSTVQDAGPEVEDGWESMLDSSSEGSAVESATARVAVDGGTGNS